MLLEQQISILDQHATLKTDIRPACNTENCIDAGKLIFDIIKITF